MAADEVSTSFQSMGLNDALLSAITEYGLDNPTPLQQRAIKPIINGADAILQTPSGGSITTFSIAALQLVSADVEAVQTLILTNTTAAAKKIERTLLAIGSSVEIDCYACTPGNSVSDDEQALANGPEVVVGLPGRIADLLERQILDTTNVKLFILDSADEMLQGGFMDQITRTSNGLPDSRQSVLVSGSLSPEISSMAENFMRDPLMIQV